MKKTEMKGNLFCFVAALLWSTGGILLKYTAGNPLAINGARSVFAYIFFVIYRRSFKISFTKNNLIGGAALLATNCLFVAANKETTAANAIVLQYLAPVLVLLWYSLYYKRKPALVQIAAEFAALCGMVLFFFDKLDAGAVLGNILAIAAGFAYSIFMFMDSLPETNGDDAAMIAFLASFIVGLPFTGSLFSEGNALSLGMLAVIGFIQLGVPHAFFAKGSQLTSPVTASLICLVEIIASPLWVYIFYGEAIGKFAFIGAILIISAVAVNIVVSSKTEKLQKT